MASTYSFGEWLKQRRKQLKLTQREVAASAYCSVAMIKKIEADERQPSVELAESLAAALKIPHDQHAIFIEVARRQRPLDHLTRQDSPVGISPAPLSSPTSLPTGTVTFLLTDVKGSTRLWEEQPEEMKAALAQHDDILREALEAHNGHIIKNTGDGWHAVFHSAPDAAQAALAAQQALTSQTSLKVRMALHTGTAGQRDGDYFGPALNLVARVVDAGHGGQILLTGAAAVLVRSHLPDSAQLTSLGHHRLKVSAKMEEIFQLTSVDLASDFPPLRSQTSSHLPTPSMPFIGRSQELETVTAQLRRDEVRLVTLVGPGGMGKTRLANEAARLVQTEFVDGALFVNLATTTDVAQLPDVIAHSLRLQLAGSADSEIIRFLRYRQMLLVLDNCEQLLGEGLEWLSHLLTEAPGVKLLATSRERLNLAEEWLFTVPELAQSADLFVQAAQRVRPEFDGVAEATAVNHICQLLGNLPLAVELAASWTPMLTCAQIAGHIQQDLGILATNLRNVPERHRNIEALFDSSWNLLSPEEQDVLMCLSVFQGGWAIEEGMAVAGANVFLLRGLVEKSLVRMDQANRYDLHPLIRQFAANKLAATNLVGETRQRHAEAFLELTGTLSSNMLGDPAAVLSRVEQEHDNLRAALKWALATDQMPLAYRLANQLSPFWFERGYRDEAIYWFSTIIEQAGDADDPELCEAIFQLIPFLVLQGRFSEAKPYSKRATTMAYRLEDPLLLAMTAVTKAAMVTDKDQAEAAFRQALAFVEQVRSTPRVLFQMGTIRGLFGDFLRENGRYQEAEVQYKKSLALIGEDLHGYRNWLLPAGNLGRLALQGGRLQEAHEAFAKCVAQARRTNSRMPLADWLLRLGESWLYLGNLAEAAACLQENITLCQEMGNPHSQADALVTLGHVVLLQGELEAAKGYIHAGFALYQQIHEQQQAAGFTGGRLIKPELVDSICRAALVALAEGKVEEAALLFGKAEASQKRIRHVPVPSFQRMIEQGMTHVRNNLPPETLKAALESGQKQSMATTLANLATE